MTKFIRNALATVCFAAGLGILVMWLWASSQPRVIAILRCDVQRDAAQVELHRSIVTLAWFTNADPWPDPGKWHVFSQPQNAERIREYTEFKEKGGTFGTGEHSVYFPIWYPALIFALAGVAVFRFRRHFSIRSALICVSVVAVLLGMAVAL